MLALLAPSCEERNEGSSKSRPPKPTAPDTLWTPIPRRQDSGRDDRANTTRILISRLSLRFMPTG